MKLNGLLVLLGVLVAVFLAAYAWGRPAPVKNVVPPPPALTAAVEQGDGPGSTEQLVRRLLGRRSMVASAEMFTVSVTDFEDQFVGPAPALPLNAPPGVIAGLVGPGMEVIEDTPAWPEAFGTRTVATNGSATLFISGNVTAIGFAGSKRLPADADPQIRCLVIKQGFYTPTATLTFELGEDTVPLYGNFAISLFSGQYGFCTFNADLVDNIVIAN